MTEKVKYSFGDFELPYSEKESMLLTTNDIVNENDPTYFQESLFHLRLGKYISFSGIEGDFVECGVYNGRSAASITLGLKYKKDNFKVYLYDSWEGFPESNINKDGEVAKTLTGEINGSLEGVKQKMEKVHPNNIIYKKGWYKDTFKDNIPEKISILHVDCDFYDSVKDTLERFYDNVVENGLIILDDFGAFQGCRLAFYEFCEEKKIRPLIRNYDHTRIFWNKTSHIESNLDRNTIMDYQWQAHIKCLNSFIE